MSSSVFSLKIILERSDFEKMTRNSKKCSKSEVNLANFDHGQKSEILNGRYKYQQCLVQE